MKTKWVIGIDEVGRGALAGPVVVAAAAVGCSLRGIATQSLGTLKDSKKLSAKQREAWYARFLSHPKIAFAVARVYPRQIEKKNISQAANLAAMRAFKRASQKLSSAAGAAVPGAVFLDGGLYLANRQRQEASGLNAKTVIKGDEKIIAVTIASIIAKVHRDRFMDKLAKQYPAYGFEVHKGYATARHRMALRHAGASEVHRKTFLSRIV